MADLDRLLTEAGERWRAGQPAPAAPGPIRPPRSRRPGPGWAAVAAVLVLAIAALVASEGGHAPVAADYATASPVADVPVPPIPSEDATPTGPSPTSLDLVDGLPVSIDGSPVLIGDAAIAAFQHSTDSRPILVGGWLHPGQLLSCPAFLGGTPWNPCAATRLFSRAFDGPEAIGIYSGQPGATLPAIPDGHVEPVVLWVHTHEPACPVSADCKVIPVLDAVVWSGGVQLVPVPTSTRPPTGMSEAAAIEAAIRFAGEQTSTGVTVLAARSGPYAIVGPGDAGIPGNSWAWAITVDGAFGPPDCQAGSSSSCSLTRASEVIVYDYVTVALLIADSPAPNPVPTTDEAQKGAINVASKFEIDRAAANWDDAWTFLGPLSQQRIGSKAQLAELETAYNVAGGGFEIDSVVAGPFDATTTDYIGSSVLDDFVRSGGDVSRAYLMYLTHPSEQGASASSVAYLIGPVDAGWRIWIAH